jgi:hypothetical protein
MKTVRVPKNKYKELISDRLVLANMYLFGLVNWESYEHVIDHLEKNDKRCNMETVTISKTEYESLIEDSKILEALHAGGVDNWEWYSESLKDFFNEEDEDED